MSLHNEAPNGECPGCRAEGRSRAMQSSRDGKALYHDDADCPIRGFEFTPDEIDAMEGKTVNEICDLMNRMCPP